MVEIDEANEVSRNRGEGSREVRSTDERAPVNVHIEGSTLDDGMGEAEGVTILVSHANQTDMMRPRSRRSNTDRI